MCVIWHCDAFTNNILATSGNIASLNALSRVVLQQPNQQTIGCQDISGGRWTVGIVAPRNMQ